MRCLKVVCTGFFFLLIGCNEDKLPSIHKWKGVAKDTGAYVYVIRNPPKTQSGLVSLIVTYIKNDPNTPADFISDEHSIFFYKESSVTPIDGNRPHAGWWEQPLTDPAMEFKEMDESEIASIRYLKDENILRLFFYGEYNRVCEVQKFGIIDVQADGTIAPLCD